MTMSDAWGIGMLGLDQSNEEGEDEEDEVDEVDDEDEVEEEEEEEENEELSVEVVECNDAGSKVSRFCRSWSMSLLSESGGVGVGDRGLGIILHRWLGEHERECGEYFVLLHLVAFVMIVDQMFACS